MSTQEIKEYYEDTFDSEIRSDLLLATSLIEGEKIAIDCGCGSGADIEYLSKEGFIVHAFDIENESIEICTKRFVGDSKVHLSLDSFHSFKYPRASLVVADASLFFCPKDEFDYVWGKIYNSLSIGGIFCGSFLGPKDTMASPSFNRNAYWKNILVFEENVLKKRFEKFEIIEFNEHSTQGKTPRGESHKWHIYSIVAKKI